MGHGAHEEHAFAISESLQRRWICYVKDMTGNCYRFVQYGAKQACFPLRDGEESIDCLEII